MPHTAFSPRPDAFLEKFHPRHITVDLEKLLRNVPGRTRRKAAPIRMFVFKYEDAPSVLQAMKSELNASKGFRAVDEVAQVNAYLSKRSIPQRPMSFDVNWSFVRDSKHPGQRMYMDFQSGHNAVAAENFFEHGISSGALSAIGQRPACLVLEIRENSWLEQQVDRIRSALHFD